MKMKKINRTSAAPRAVPPFETVNNEERWLVWDGKDVRSLTLDELDEAFQRGDIGPATKVFTSGMSTWQTLGVLANLDDAGNDLERPAQQPAPARASTGTVRRPAEQGSIPPLNLGIPAQLGAKWWHATALTPQPITGVQRRPGVLMLALRQVLAWLQNGASRSGQPRRQLALSGWWAVGGALSALLIAALHQVVTSPGEEASGVVEGAPRASPQLAAAVVPRDPVGRVPPKVEPRESEPAVAVPASGEQRQEIAALRSPPPRVAPVTFDDEEPPRRASRAKASGRASSEAAQRAKRAARRRNGDSD
jgi:hypothetical protein